MHDGDTGVAPEQKSLLVLGVGNILMGDEGVGIHALRLLESLPVPLHVRLLDGGTGGFHLLSLFQEYPVIVFIDATMDGSEAGTVRVLRPRFASDFPRTLSAHDIGLRDLLESAALIGPLPELHLVTVSIAAMQPMSMELSPPVNNALGQVVREVRTLIAEIEGGESSRS